jgi:hypothetical protein
MEKKDAQVPEVITTAVTASSFTVYRPHGNSFQIQGPDSCDVRDGCLLILRRDAQGNEAVSHVFGPGQWITVNVQPV